MSTCIGPKHREVISDKNSKLLNNRGVVDHTEDEGEDQPDEHMLGEVEGENGYLLLYMTCMLLQSLDSMYFFLEAFHFVLV
jgi:hypothetical protein